MLATQDNLVSRNAIRCAAHKPLTGTAKAQTPIQLLCTDIIIFVYNPCHPFKRLAHLDQ